MRILLLNEYFPPDTSATAKMAAAVADALAEKHEVTVVCGRPSYDPSERHAYYLRRREKRGRVNVVRVGSTAYPRLRMLHRISNYLSYVAFAIPTALLIRTDLVLAMTDPPFAGIVGGFVAWVKGSPFAYNIRDLYPEMALEGRIVRSSLLISLWEKLHRWALGRAVRVIVLGEDTRERIIAKGIDPERVLVVRDGTRIPQILPGADHPIAQEIRSGFRFVVMHAGNLGFYGAWDTLLQAAQLLNGDGIGFVFVGDGALREQIRTSANGCGSVRFLPFRPPEEVGYVLAAGDLHLISIRSGLEGVVVPSKLYPILAAGRPVLALASEQSDAARVVRRTGCGVVADPEDPRSVAAAIRELSADPERLTMMGRRAREIAANFEMDKELQRFREALEAIAGSDGGDSNSVV